MVAIPHELVFRLLLVCVAGVDIFVRKNLLLRRIAICNLLQRYLNPAIVLMRVGVLGPFRAGVLDRMAFARTAMVLNRAAPTRSIQCSRVCFGHVGCYNNFRS